MSSSTNDNAVSHAGMLKNMLNHGFTSRKCLSELADNSLSADASDLCLTICTTTNTLWFSDNAGIKKDLAAAFRFHERSAASKKHGRFGIGLKFAMVNLTVLKSIAHVFTRPNDGDDIYQLSFDYPKAIKDDRLTINPHGIERKCDPMWDTYAIDSKRKGTVIHLPSDKSIVQEIVSMITADTVENNLLFDIGTTYYTALSGDITYQINIDDTPYHVMPIDRLCWDSINENNKMTVVFRVCHHLDDSSDIRAYYTDPFTNQVGYRLKINRGQTNNFIVEEYPEHFISLGPVSEEIAYSSDWVTLLEEELIYCGIAVPEGKGKGPISEKLGGTEIKRNGRVAKVLPVKKKSSGDFRVRSTHQNTKVRISFDAVHNEQLVGVDSKTMDDVFNTQVDKSDLDEDTINKSLWAGICQVRIDFVQHLCKRADHLPPKSAKKPQENSESDESDSEDSDSEEHIPSIVAVPVVAPKTVVAPKPVVASKPVIAPKPAVVSNPIVASSPVVAANPVAAPIPPSNPVVVQVALPPSSESSLPSPTAPSQVASVTQIPAHIRNTSKCPREIVQLLDSIYTTYGPRLADILERADIATRPKLIDDYNALVRISDLLKEYSS